MIVIEEILKKYFGFDSFRASQDKIIESALSGKDTLAILPTGGGKSLCYQIPALAKPGICLVVSPLLALIKDQIVQLKKNNIRATSLAGGISFDETIQIINNCILSDYKFLFVSPEKLQQEFVVEKLQEAHINLIAVDEAHCISQWGNDFRPAYLDIYKIREKIKAPIIALTASATEKVQADIVEKLGFENYSVFKESVFRPNIGYHTTNTEDKLGSIKRILSKNTKPTIVYVKSRKDTERLAKQIEEIGFSSTFYHGGLSKVTKERNMQLWLEEKSLVMVATNAFGMGIDKPNVKTVIHYSIPENIESYYQEVGRAGRNNELAFGVLLYNKSDLMVQKEYFENHIPDLDFLKLVYNKINNHFYVGYGDFPEESFGLDFLNFCKKFNLNQSKTLTCLKFLDNQSIFQVDENLAQKIQIQFKISQKELLRYSSLHNEAQNIIEYLIRSYPGILSQPTKVSLSHLLKTIYIDENKLVNQLQVLANIGIAEIKFEDSDFLITYLEPREDQYTINRIAKNFKSQMQHKKNLFSSMMDFIENNEICKSVLLMNYFDEKETKNCGICSCCLSRENKKQNLDYKKTILDYLNINEASFEEIYLTTKISHEILISEIRNLLENNYIILTSENKYKVI